MSIIELWREHAEPAGRLKWAWMVFILLGFYPPGLRLTRSLSHLMIYELFRGRRSNGTGQSVSNGRASCGSGMDLAEAALNVMVFSVLHFPCGTTLLTISNMKDWPQRMRWTAVAHAVTTGTACLACILLARAVRILRLLFLLWSHRGDRRQCFPQQKRNWVAALGAAGLTGSPSQLLSPGRRLSVDAGGDGLQLTVGMGSGGTDYCSGDGALCHRS